MASRITFKVADYSGETASVTIPGPALTGANYDAQVAEATGLAATLQAITLGEVQSYVLTAENETISGDLPTSPYAQREVKLHFTYSDNVTGKRGSFTVPAPDLANLDTTPSSDAVTLADAGIMAAFVTAIQGFMLSPEGNAITIQSARVVGRNL